MRTYRFFCVIIILLLSLSAKGQETTAALTAQPTVEIKKSAFYLNGKIVKLPIPSADLERIIGKPDRSKEGARKISTWDKLGLIAYQKTDSDNFIEIGIVLNVLENKFDFTPDNPYRGSFTIDGAKLTADSTRNTVNQKKTGPKFRPIPLVGMLSDYKTGDLNLIMWQAEGRRASGLGKILQISIAETKK